MSILELMFWVLGMVIVFVFGGGKNGVVFLIIVIVIVVEVDKGGILLFCMKIIICVINIM